MNKCAINLFKLILVIIFSAICTVSVNGQQDCIYGYGFDNGLNDYTYAVGSTDKGGASIVCVDATECMRLSCGSSVQGDNRFVRVIKHMDIGDDFSLSSDILAKEYRTQQFSMLFCYKDNDNYYALCWSQDKIPSFWDVGHNKKLYLRKYADGAMTTLGECEFNTVDLWRNYKIEFSDGNIVVSVDDEVVISCYDDNPLMTKNIGFDTYTDSYCAAEVIIDNVLIKNTDVAAHEALESIADHSVFMSIKSPWLITPHGRYANDPYDLTVSPLYKGEEIYIPFETLAKHSFTSVENGGDILYLYDSDDVGTLNLKTGEYIKNGATKQLSCVPVTYKNNVFLNIYDAANLLQKNVVIKNDIIVFSDINMNEQEIPLQMIEALLRKNEDDGRLSLLGNDPIAVTWQGTEETQYSSVTVTDEQIDITVGMEGQANRSMELAKALTVEEYQNYTAKFKIKLSPVINEEDALTEYCGMYLSYTDENNFLALEWSRRLEGAYPRIALVKNGYESSDALIKLPPNEWGGIDIHEWSEIKIEKNEEIVKIYACDSNIPFLMYDVGDSTGRFGFFNRSMWGKNSVLSISDIVLYENTVDNDKLTTILYRDNFDDDTKITDYEISEGSISIENGVLATSDDTKTIFSIGNAEWGEYDFSSEITSNGEYEISYMNNGLLSGCSVTAKSNGYLIFKVNGVLIDEISPDLAGFIPQSTNHISFERINNCINVLINGNLCFKYVDKFGIIKSGCMNFVTLDGNITIDNIFFRANISQETVMYAFADVKNGNVNVTMSIYPFTDESEFSGKLVVAAYQDNRLMGVGHANFTTENEKMTSQLRVGFNNLIPDELCEIKFFVWDEFMNLRPLLTHKVKKVYNYIP